MIRSLNLELKMMAFHTHNVLHHNALHTCRWTPVNHMLTPRMNLGVGAIKDMRDAVTGVTFNAIYAIGGYSGKAILGTAEKYEIQTDTWSEIAPMKTPRRNVGE